MMDFFMTLQLKASIRRLKSQIAPFYPPYKEEEAFSKNKKIFLLYDWCFTGSWIPHRTSQLTETVTNYQNYSHKLFKTVSEPKPFVWWWALNGRSAYSATPGFRKEGARRIFKILELSMRKLPELKLFSHKEQFWLLMMILL